MNDLIKISSIHPSAATILPSYVLITPAWNEEAFIETTLKSIVAQTIRPMKWVIVSDGSTDGTNEIVKKYCEQHVWIELVELPKRAERHFAGKVNAFNAGYRKLEQLDYKIIGNIDADTSFDNDHFEFLLKKFAMHPTLGIAGTAYSEGTGQKYNYDIVSVEDVAGACQLFRRECFVEIGGYIPMKKGGIDSIACYTACMKGWITRTFPEKTFTHYRKYGTGQDKLLISLYKFGIKDYYLGGSILWEIIRSLYQMTKKPYVVGGILLFVGYLSALVQRIERPVSHELIAFRKKEQIERLKKIIRNVLMRDKKLF